MADENKVTEVVVFEIDVQSYEKALADQAKAIGELKKQQKSLTEEAQKGNEAAAASVEKLNAEIKISQQEYRTTQNVLVGYLGQTKKLADTENFLNNSIQTNRDLLKQLTAQYINTTKPSEALTNKVKTLSDALKQQEAAIGDTRRNVGNYAAGFVDAIGKINIGGKSLSGIIDPLKNITSGFKDAGGGAAGFQAALLGGIPLIIAGLQGVFSTLQKFDTFSEGLEDMGAGLNRVFDDLVANGNKPFTSFSELKKDLLESYENGKNLNIELRLLGEQEDEAKTRAADADRIVTRLLLQSKDRTKTEKERIALLDVASELEKKNFEDEVRFSIQRKNIAEAELKRVTEAGLNDDKQKADLQKAKRAVIELDSQNLNLQEKITNRRNALLDSEKERREKEEKAREAALIKEGQRLQKENQDHIAALAQLRTNAELQEKIKEQTGKSDEEIDRLFAERNQSKLADFRDFADALLKEQDRINKESARIQAENKIFAAAEKEIRDNAQKQLDLQKLYAEKTLALIPESAEKTLMLKEVANNAQQLIDEEFARSNYETFAEFYAAKKELYKSDIEEAKKAAQDILKLSEQQKQAVEGIASEAQTVLTGIGDILNQEIEDKQNNLQAALDRGAISEKEFADQSRELKQKQFEQNKAISLTTAITQGILATLAAYSSGAAIPIVGVVTGPVFAGIAAAFAAIQVGLIASQQPPKFATGVIGLNGPGTGTSDSINAKLSKGESVVTAKATSVYHKELAQMELSVGNKPNYNFGSGKFATGVIGVSPVTSDGGFASNQITDFVAQSQLLKEAIRQGFISAPAPVVSVREINKVNTSVNRSVGVSEL